MGDIKRAMSSRYSSSREKQICSTIYPCNLHKSNTQLKTYNSALTTDLSAGVFPADQIWTEKAGKLKERKSDRESWEIEGETEYGKEFPGGLPGHNRASTTSAFLLSQTRSVPSIMGTRVAGRYMGSINRSRSWLLREGTRQGHEGWLGQDRFKRL